MAGWRTCISCVACGEQQLVLLGQGSGPSGLRRRPEGSGPLDPVERTSSRSGVSGCRGRSLNLLPRLLNVWWRLGQHGVVLVETSQGADQEDVEGVVRKTTS